MSLFGAQFQQVWPKPSSSTKLTEFGKSLLAKCKTVEKPDASKVDLNEFIMKSRNFPLEFGTNTCRVSSQPRKRYSNIQRQIASAYPVIHERVLGLYLSFLEYKCQFSNQIENYIYCQLTLTGLIQRLLTKRCAYFIGGNDSYQLISGEVGFGGFEDVGSLNGKAPLLLENVLSYDEIKLSAFLSVSSHSEFINDGSWYNEGAVEANKSRITPEGVIIGLIGGRFERKNVMEWQDILITRTQNIKENGYGEKMSEITATTSQKNLAQEYRRLWNEFYEDEDFLYKDVERTDVVPRFFKLPQAQIFFDNVAMKKRYAISFDTLLLEAQTRATAASKQAYIHVVGIGLGVWRKVDHQSRIFLETFAERLKVLLPQLSHVSVVHFSHFHVSECGDLQNGGTFKSDTHPEGGIQIFLSDRNPADKLNVPGHENMLLIVSYAWDGNALPGNEFWAGSLSGSGDPAAACSSLITEVHNPFINTDFVSGKNLHIATDRYGVIHIADYANKISQ